jgi:predicted RNase H-like nuclease
VANIRQVTITCFVGVDLAWAQRSDGRPDNETGLVALDREGRVLAAGWARGVPATLDWLRSVVDPGGSLIFVDASLIVDNPTGQRLCETQVGQRYGRWKVSANSTNQRLPHQAGVALLAAAEALGWRYDSGLTGPPVSGVRLSESYPYATLVGTAELGYHADSGAERGARPLYKRMPRGWPVAAWRPVRAANCDELIRRLARLAEADPPLRLDSHPVTRELLEVASPLADRPYKHREDLIDATIAAWTALLWSRHGRDRCQVLGPAEAVDGREATIIAAALDEQCRPPRPAERGG